MYDVIVVGAGPAGLSAALILGRCRRRVLVCDTGKPRNAAALALHGFLTRDGIPPLVFLQTAREQLRQYDTIEQRDAEVRSAECRPDGRFDVCLAAGETLEARKLLLATGVVDNLPDLPGFAGFYGRGVFHCPYCDGWEVRDRPLAIYGRGARGLGLALELTAWSSDLTLCTDGPAEIDADGLARLARNGVTVIADRIARLEGEAALERIVFASGISRPCGALFFTTGQAQQSPLAVRLGCQISDKGTVATGKYEATHLKGLYVAGDASRAVQWAIVAAAEGAEAAFAINTELIKEDLR